MKLNLKNTKQIREVMQMFNIESEEDLNGKLILTDDEQVYVKLESYVGGLVLYKLDTLSSNLIYIGEVEND